MSTNKIYCGTKDAPKGKRKGTMSQCVNKNQVRLYGLKVVDPKLLIKDKKRPTKPVVTLHQVFLLISEVNGKITRLERSITEKMRNIVKVKVEADIKKLKEQRRKYINAYKRLEKHEIVYKSEVK